MFSFFALGKAPKVMRTDHELLEQLREELRRVSWIQPFLGLVEVKVEGGEVVVNGRVPGDYLKGAVLRLIGATPGVGRVIDHLSVEETHPRVGVQIDWTQGTMVLI
jgi:osmotically-inducible protein OsmY